LERDFIVVAQNTGVIHGLDCSDYVAVGGSLFGGTGARVATAASVDAAPLAPVISIARSLSRGSLCAPSLRLFVLFERFFELFLNFYYPVDSDDQMRSSPRIGPLVNLLIIPLVSIALPKRLPSSPLRPPNRNPQARLRETG
jgi:hypothetical protein